MYKVEKILEKRIEPKTKKQQYLIKWDGYDLQVSTWEPLEHLQYCIDLVKDFQKKLANKKERDTQKKDLTQKAKNTRLNKTKPAKTEQNNYKWSNRLRTKQQICYNPERKDQQQGDEDFLINNQSEEVLIKRPLQLKLRNRKNMVAQSGELKLGEELESIQLIKKKISKQNGDMKKKTSKNQEIHEGSHEIKDSTKKVKQIRKRIIKLAKDKNLRKKFKLLAQKKKQKIQKRKIKQKRLKRRVQLQVKHENESDKSHQMQIQQKVEPKEELVEKPETLLRIPNNKRPDLHKQMKVGLGEDEHERKADQGGSQEKDTAKVQVIGMRRISEAFEFFLQKGNIEGWSTHKFVLDNYPRELCAFYQKNIEFQ